MKGKQGSELSTKIDLVAWYKQRSQTCGGQRIQGSIDIMVQLSFNFHIVHSRNQISLIVQEYCLSIKEWVPYWDSSFSISSWACSTSLSLHHSVISDCLIIVVSLSKIIESIESYNCSIWLERRPTSL